MSTSVIIDARDRLRWHQRFAWEASTAALWGAWLCLWTPVLETGNTLARLWMEMPWLPKLLRAAGTGSVPLSLLALAGTSGTLVVWRNLPVRTASTAEELPVAEYARHFQLSEQVIETGRGASTCVVHHDPEGRIVEIECLESAAQAA
jgi:poly-beta-1,6-N-acetyl-D-glucosamine biosynthesis protein PgaD